MAPTSLEQFHILMCLGCNMSDKMNGGPQLKNTQKQQCLKTSSWFKCIGFVIFPRKGDCMFCCLSCYIFMTSHHSVYNHNLVDLAALMQLKAHVLKVIFTVDRWWVFEDGERDRLNLTPLNLLSCQLPFYSPSTIIIIMHQMLYVKWMM